MHQSMWWGGGVVWADPGDSETETKLCQNPLSWVHTHFCYKIQFQNYPQLILLNKGMSGSLEL